MELEIITDDITRLSVDAIVNAANSTLLGGGGVDGAIHRAAGENLLEECKIIRRSLPDGLQTGCAVVTKGYNLSAKHVIHTVGPIYHQYSPREAAILLGSAYRNSLLVAEAHSLSSIAFPAISTGVYGYPREDAAHVVRKILDAFKPEFLNKIVLCYFSDEDRHIAERIIRT